MSVSLPSEIPRFASKASAEWRPTDDLVRGIVKGLLRRGGPENSIGYVMMDVFSGVLSEFTSIE
jgi:hypothetical protein